MRILWFSIFILFTCSCERREDPTNELLLKHTHILRNELKSSIKSDEEYLNNRELPTELYRKIYKEVYKKKYEFESRFEEMRFGDEQKLIVYLDSFNNKCNLNLKLNTYEQLKDVHDSIFNLLIEIDFLRMKKKFIQDKMYVGH